MHPSNRVTEDNLEDVFTFHPATEQRARKHQAIRAMAMDFARTVLAYTPPCADQSAALRKIRETVMIANAAIALEPLENVLQIGGQTFEITPEFKTLIDESGLDFNEPKVVEAFHSWKQRDGSLDGLEAFIQRWA